MWKKYINLMIGRPIGISLVNGQGVSGVLCDVQDKVLYVLVYMYQDQFAMKKYDYNSIDDVHPFPACRKPQPKPQPVY